MNTDRSLLQGPVWLRLFVLGSLVLILLFAAGSALNSIGAIVSAALVPLLVSLLLTALLMPLQILLNHRLRLNRHLAAGLTLVLSTGAIGAVLYLAGAQLVNGIADLRDSVAEQLDSVRDWLLSSSLPITEQTIDGAIDRAQEWLSDSRGTLVEGAVNVGVSTASFLFGTFLALLATFFFLAQGDKIWAWCITALPAASRRRTYEASRRAWVTLSTYVKTQVVVSGIDAIGIALGAWILGLPFVIPLLIITFVLCVIPVVGAFISGALAVLIALTFEGLGSALIMLAIVLVVQQLEGDVLSPLLMGKAVKIHPVVVLFAIAAGGYAFGFLGALFVVPLIATANTGYKYLNGRDPFPVLDEGGSALTDRPSKLVGDIVDVQLPARVGDATPVWLIAARNASEEGKTEPSPGHLAIAEAELDLIERDRVEAERIAEARVEAERIEARKIIADEVEGDEVKADQIEADEIQADVVKVNEVDAEVVEPDEPGGAHEQTGTPGSRSERRD
ncbi:AI-2E family transporter [Blastococcus sp. Marseille-P5729]|uniref:AI-2E family transporter n=1 Tax=Blastococcus sp. Marseille-P5729 TaxID=2086582 RepID=UPI000D111F4A|nr:AI-2E family transporter [Blastococcus sp. Marseille-P5729]